jgi:hypothetical protein
MESVKRLGAKLLLAVFALNSLGLFLAFEWQQWHIQSAVQKAIETGPSPDEIYEVTVVAENAAQLQWYEDHEFRYHGTMYDVVQKKVLNADTTVYYCLADLAETSLLSNLDKFVKKSTEPLDSSRRPTISPFQLFAPAFFPTQKHTDSCRFFPTNNRWEYYCHYSPPFLTPNAPPPRFS